MFGPTLEEFCELHGFDIVVVRSCIFGCSVSITVILIIAFIGLTFYKLFVLLNKYLKRGKSNDKGTCL